MLFLLFQIGAGRYALEAKRVAEVLPLLPIRPLAKAPPGVAGALNYRGAPLAVIDLSRLIAGRPAAARMSTRIVVVNCANGKQAGFITERANETFERDPAAFAATGVTIDSAPYLGPVAQDARGFVQWLEPDKLLHEAMFAPLEEVA
jgi:chemotaxis-related protein WspB